MASENTPAGQTAATAGKEMTTMATTSRACERCAAPPILTPSRRFRCLACKRLVCRRCCSTHGSGQGQGSTRSAECFDCQKAREETGKPRNIGKPHAKPTDRRNWCTIGDTVTATDGPQAMKGTVERVALFHSIPVATVKWSNGSVGRHTITTLRKVICHCGITSGMTHSLGTCVATVVG